MATTLVQALSQLLSPRQKPPCPQPVWSFTHTHLRGLRGSPVGLRMTTRVTFMDGKTQQAPVPVSPSCSSILLPSTPPSASWLPRGLSASCFLYVESRLCWLCLSTFYSPFISPLQCDFLVSAFPDLTYNCPLLYALIDPFSFTSLGL